MEWESSGVGEWESAVCFFDISDSLDINVCVCMCMYMYMRVCVCVCVDYWTFVGIRARRVYQ